MADQELVSHGLMDLIAVIVFMGPPRMPVRMRRTQVRPLERDLGEARESRQTVQYLGQNI